MLNDFSAPTLCLGGTLNVDGKEYNLWFTGLVKLNQNIMLTVKMRMQ